MLVSICIPIYNVEKYIERCAVSLFEQSYNSIEYVFIDDCSEDSSIERLKSVIKRYPQRKEHFVIINHEKNKGLSAARNTAVYTSTGEFILHVDSDDYLDINAVEKLINKQKETDADIVTGQAVCINKANSYVMDRPQYCTHQDFVLDMIKPSIHHTIWGRLIRKSLYLDHQIKAKEGVNIGEDLQVMTQLAYYATKLESIWDVVYFYNCTNDFSYMNQFDLKHIKRLTQDTESMEVVREFFQGKNSTYQDCAEKYLFDYYLELLRFYGRTNNREEYTRIKKSLSDLHPQNRKMSKRQKIKFNSYCSFKFTELLQKSAK